MGVRIANTYNILRKQEGVQKINMADFCLFHLLMARPDPEVDSEFLDGYIVLLIVEVHGFALFTNDSCLAL